MPGTAPSLPDAEAPTRAPRPRPRAGGRRCRRPAPRPQDERNEVDEIEEGDRDRARRTVPRGEDAGDRSPEPGVPLETWLLHVRYARTGRADHLQDLVAEYDQYALSLARRLRRDREPNDDLDQVARESLVVALQRFDPDRGIPFPAFATPTILGALRRHYRDNGWSIRVPRRVHELAGPVREATDRLTASLGRQPTEDEVAAALGVTAGELRDVGQASRARNPSSLDAPPAPDGVSPHEVVGRPDRGLLGVEERVDLAEAVEHLDDRDREIIGLYFFEELTQTQIAERYGVSQMQVSRWIASTLRRLRARMEA